MRQTDALAVSLQERQRPSVGHRGMAGEPAADEQPAAPKRKPRRRKAKPAVSAIDDNLDSVDWLLTAPSEDNPARFQALNQTPDPDFGYQPPGEEGCRRQRSATVAFLMAQNNKRSLLYTIHD